ncbi:hydrolase [Photobacterium jeanii]|uniref:Hydrolase n=1 Tax=Photobacterium jeanii TaxID=858640 RepID=A0A178K7L2_9GAMM|nr:HAD family hydrolase [Photobacterium jeanii]OAN13117.1 hydrolase [Photobacterium jeanii]PST89267.1 HAD-IB family hydrolase [Photobacterium jeanii]
MSVNNVQHHQPYLAIFDLDETLIAADSASLWAAFLVEQQLARPNLLTEEQEMMVAYAKGDMDMHTYMQATLEPLKGKDKASIATLVEQFIEQKIKPALYQDGLERIQWHKKRGDTVVIASATSEHLVKPIANMLGVDDAIAIELEMLNNIYTGNTKGILSYQQGKVTRMKAWIADSETHYRGCYGYSDSVNDLPLLNAVDKPFAVNPDPTLAMHAQMKDWTIMDWRHDNNILR